MVRKLWIYFLYKLTCCVISLRYRVHTQGLEKLKPLEKGGVLFLPNHPAEIDPVIVMLILWRHYKPRPLVLEKFYYLTGAHYLQKLVGAIPIPDLNGQANKWKENKIEKIFQQISEGLKSGENYLIYPSGRLKYKAEESLGGASFVHRLIFENPKIQVVLIRTTGLWGSRFSTALTGNTPDFVKIFWEGIKIVLKNGIFFIPRRDVYVDIEPAAQDFPKTSPRLEFNRYLEKWYNKKGPEPLTFVSDVFWKKNYPFFKASEKVVNPSDVSWEIDPEMEAIICNKIAELSKQKTVFRHQHLSQDLGLDSLDNAQLLLFIEDKYEIEGVSLLAVDTVEDVLKALSQAMHSKKTSEAAPEQKWPAEKDRPSVFFPEGQTLQEVFFRSCERMGNAILGADQILGFMTYKRFKLLALSLSSQIKRLEGKYIGVLLPSSLMVYVVIFAILLAKKVPVMVNWTVGSRTMDHCVNLAELKTVISSRRFLDNLNNAPLGLVGDILLLLEDLKEEISWKAKLQAFYRASFFKTSTLMRNLGLSDISEEETAVVLFTSGTELLSKGVPLSHRNLLSNQRASFSCVSFLSTDSLYAVLPPFHSFGFSLTGLLPIFIGVKSYFAPDPTNNRGMVNDIANWQLTIFCCAPTFIRGLFRVAVPSKLKSLRYVVAGAEKAPEDIITFTEKLGAQFIEGYGITECSPVVSLTRVGLPRRGVGQPIPGVELCIIDPETQTRLPSLSSEGEICIYGPNIFKGYLDKRTQSPFIEIEGRKWYKSGDMGYIDETGCLILSGRLKRFVKIGGEMISLGGLEVEILRLAKEKKWLQSQRETTDTPLAIAVSEKESSRPSIILFATFAVEKSAVNEALRECGYGRLIKISEIKQIPQIPVSTTGKVQYRVLDEMLT